MDNPRSSIQARFQELRATKHDSGVLRSAQFPDAFPLSGGTHQVPASRGSRSGAFAGERGHGASSSAEVRLLTCRAQLLISRPVHIAELQLIGFKSFLEKTTLRFSPRMNAVIGPNGCGKTNILDALRWVLGEQSFTVLRCGRTEDLVFGGTALVPALNMAEVRLVLANDQLEQYGSEIEIKRRYFRTGESEYYLNRQLCRLKDIQEVFLASGIGTKAYSIFDLRQMRDIIAGNIRKMFEEAASLAKYHDAKEDCVRKLELTQSDLVRLEDIITERERFVRSLRRQLGKLHSYEKLKEEEKSYRLLELKAEYDSLGREAARVESDAACLEQAEADRLNQIRATEEELARHRTRLRQEQSLKDELAQSARDGRQQLAELLGKDLLARQRIEFLAERAKEMAGEREGLGQGALEQEAGFNRTVELLAQANDELHGLERRLEQAQEETRQAEQALYERRRHRESCLQAYQEIVARHHEQERRLAQLAAVRQNQSDSSGRLDDEAAELGRREAECRAELSAAEAELGRVRTEVDRLAREVEETEAALEQVRQSSAAGHEALGRRREERVRRERELAVLAAGAHERIEQARVVLGERLLGDVSQMLVVEPGWERAAEAALQPVLDLLVTAREIGPAERQRLLAEGPERGCGLLSAQAQAQAQAADTARIQNPKSEIQNPAVLGRLADYVQVNDSAPDAVRALVESSLVVGDDADLAGLLSAFPGRTLVSRSGWALLPDGRLALSGRAESRLKLERLIQERSAELAQAEQAVSESADKQAALEQEGLKLDRRVEETRARLAEAWAGRSSLEARHDVLKARLAELERDRERLAADRTRLADGVRAEEQDAERTRAEADKLAQQLAEQNEFLKGLAEQVGSAEREARQRLDAASERLAELGTRRQRVVQLESEVGFYRRGVEERRRRIAELERAATEAGEEARALEAAVSGRGPELEQARTRIAEVEERIDALKVADLAQVEEQLETNLAELRRTRDQNQELLMQHRLQQQELRAKLASVAEEARDIYKTDIAQFESAETGDVVERLARVRQRLELLGKVNPLAREEYEQERTDLERLRGQRDDVLQARENLAQTMLEIDKHARDRFLETYQEVRGHFQTVFRQMFLEGEADLVLVDQERPLESEIAIIARPRGKTPKRLEQLSDGEKALLAVSLLFAFYRVKPASFCFMDEIDAPLDDANVGRFADYLKALAQSTQVVIITHNRATVERAESVFGVTAEQPGVSKLVSISLAQAQEQAQAQVQAQAQAPEPTKQ